MILSSWEISTLPSIMYGTYYALSEKNTLCFEPIFIK